MRAQSEPDAGSIEGHVLNSQTSAPIRKATVILTAPQIHLLAITDSEGKFQFSGLPPAAYKLSASKAGFRDRAARRGIPVGRNEQVSSAEIRLPPQSAISGHVLDEAGEPVDHALILMFRQTYRYGTRTWERLNKVSETNDAGEYRVADLDPQRYIVQAIDHRPTVDNQYGKGPKSFYPPVYYPNTVNQQDASPVVVTEGAEAGGIDIRLFKIAVRPTVRVRGRVAGMPPNSRSILQIDLLKQDSNEVAEAQALPPDYAFELRATPGRYMISGRVYSGGPEAYGTGNIDLTGDQDGTLLVMRAAPDIDGHIVFSEGPQMNLKGLVITLAGISRFMASGEFDLREEAQGRLSSFPAALRRPGHFSLVNVRSLPEGYFIRAVKLGGQEVSPNDFEIQGSAELDFVLSNMAGKIIGTVGDTDDKPAPGSTVTLIPADGQWRPVKQVADDVGKFQFTNLRPGKYKLFAWEEVDDDSWQDPEFRGNYENRGREITVGPGEIQNAELRAIVADQMK